MNFEACCGTHEWLKLQEYPGMQPPAIRLLSRSQMTVTGLTMRFVKAAVASDNKRMIFISAGPSMGSIGDVQSGVIDKTVYYQSESVFWRRRWARQAKLLRTTVSRVVNDFDG